MGASSGGHLTLSIAARGLPGNPEASDPVERESSEVRAAACFFPPTDFLNYGGADKSGVGDGPLAPLEVAFGSKELSPEEKTALGREISPIYYINSKLPPTLGRAITGACATAAPAGTLDVSSLTPSWYG